MEPLPTGRRERKKRVTRTEIAAVARALFAERGFDVVTVAEVAAAADVSEKTVFNHFPTKVDLAFAGQEEGIVMVVAAVAGKPAGTPVIDVFRQITETVLEHAVAGEDEDLLAVARILRQSPALHERLAVGWESGASAIADAVAEASGAAADDLVPGLVARTLWWTHRSIFRAALEGLLAGEDPQALAQRLRGDAARAYDRLAAGLGDYGA